MGHENDRVVAGLISERDLCKIREAVCIQVEKIFDSCREKDCIEDARVLFKNTESIRKIIHRAINVKAKRAEVVDVYSDIEPVPFKRGFYTVDIKFFIRVELDFFVPRENGSTRIITRKGLVLFDKKVILFGSEGSVKIFKAHFSKCGVDDEGSRLQQDNLPFSKIEVADPIALSARIQESCDKYFDDCCNIEKMPRSVCNLFGEEEDVELDDADDIVEDEFGRRRVLVTVGLFSIIKLARLVQLLIPAFDFCVPNKECIASTEDDPCELFETIEFPVDEFFPPQIFDFPGALEAVQEMQEGIEGNKNHSFEG